MIAHAPAPAIGYIYAIESGDAVKIGWAGAPLRRLSELNVGSPGTHRLIGFINATRSQEAELHQLLAPARVRGEWFSKSRVVRHFLDMLPKFSPVPVLARGKDNSTDTVFAAFGTLNDFAQAAGCKYSTASEMKRRRSIPVRWWPNLIASHKGQAASLSSESLAHAHAKTAPSIPPSPPRRPAPVHGPHCRHDQSHGEPRDNHYCHIPLNAGGIS